MSELLDDKRQSGSLRGVWLLRPYSGWLALVVGLLFLLTFVDMAAPYFLKLLIDDVFPQSNGGGNLHLLWLILPGMVLIYAARNILFYLSRMRALRISEDLCFDLRKQLFDHLQRLNLSFYRTHQPGRLSARLMDDTFKIQAFIQDKLPTLLRYFLEFQILLIIIYLMNWRLAVASTIILPLHLATSHYFRNSIRQSHSQAQESLASAHGNIVEKFLGMEVVKGFNAEERESRTFRKAIDASRQNQIRSQRFHFSQKVVADLLVGVGTVVLLGYGTWNVVRGRMKSGEFLMFFLYVKMLYPAVLEIISGIGHLSKATASVDRVFEMLAEPAGDANQDMPLAVPLAGHIAYQNVCFRYGEDSTCVLKDLNFAIEPGEHVAITGPSGSGKSTLISLLPRFNDATSGQVLIDGRPAPSLPISALRDLFGIVFQEVFLFNTSIYENLRYARPEATMQEVIAACKVTGAHDFIQRLPQGYYTQIGGAGGELSRGERQRITLARALIKRPQILIFDEATASIDTPAAQEIVRSILGMMKGGTVIMVTHETDLLELVDRVISIEAGQVVYDGPPQDYTDSTRTLPIEDVAKTGPNVRPKVSPLFTVTSKGDTPIAKIRRHLSGPLAGLFLLGVLLLNSCVPAVKSERSLDPNGLRPFGGVIIEEEDPNQLSQLAEALDRMTLGVPSPMVVSDEGAAGMSDAQTTEVSEVPLPKKLALVDALNMTGETTLPPDSVRLLSLPKLSDIEMREMQDRLALRLGADFGYIPASGVMEDALPAAPKSIRDSITLLRSTDDGTHVLRFGFQRYISQPPQLWGFGVMVNSDGVWSVNPDLNAIEPAAKEMVMALHEMRKGLTFNDMEAKLIQLSYVDATIALAMLKGMGLSTVDKPEGIPAITDFAKLPYVVGIPDPGAEDTGLIGTGTGTQETKTKWGLSLTPGVASAITDNAVVSPMSQLMVIFHPAHPEQFSRVRRALDTYIDRPARQIFIEAMVLEIGEEGLEDLGIEWQMAGNPLRMDNPLRVDTLGSLNVEGGDTLDLAVSNLTNIVDPFEGIWSVKIRALVRTGKAEILSRPSVLTINNRQSTIRVGRDLPIANSYEGLYSNSNKVSFSFQYLPTGILLNIRPRINEAGTEVSMLIDTMVSARVPDADLEMKSSTGTVLATAPTISTRRVQTYGRIRNNTPFIIGGLVSREQTLVQDKVPLLGDIPVLGFLFRSKRSENIKREVIIVLTPYILPEKKLIPRSLPKDEDLFDSFGHELFRDSYRIRNEDVFDLTFLLENPRIVDYRTKARQVVEQNFRLGETEPFRSFIRDQVPGESILVTRMIYDVVKRLELADKVNPTRVIYLAEQQVGGYNVGFLEELLDGQASGTFTDFGNQALAITFNHDRTSDTDDLSDGPLPEIRMIDCPNRDVWGQKLWELNQPTARGQRRHTILIQSDTDLLRLRRALALKKIAALNGGSDQLRLRNFSVGKVLLMPQLKEDQIHLIDTDAAMFFFHTEQYYAATLAKIETQIKEIDTLLHQPEIQTLLDSVDAQESSNP
ncbi:ABC transporter transmembrane domain-containing protein [Planctomycetota bacterium]